MHIYIQYVIATLLLDDKLFFILSKPKALFNDPDWLSISDFDPTTVFFIPEVKFICVESPIEML